MQRVTGQCNAGFGIAQAAAFADRIVKLASASCHGVVPLSRIKRQGVLVVPAALAGCNTPLSALAPAGPAASDIAVLWWVMLAGAGVLTLLVLALVAVGFGRPRDVAGRRWSVMLGVWFPLAVLGALLAVALWAGERALPRGAAVEVRAHAFQFGWTFTHPGPDGPVETATVLHIPAGQPVDVLITAEDVIHSFWVPRLGGKLDAIPGRENRLRLQADAPGTYAGLCAEFCGLGHAAMAFDVVAHPPENWPPRPQAEATQ